MALTVSQRTRQIGIRMALGAQPLNVMRMVLGQGLVLAGLGVGIGIVGALVLTGGSSRRFSLRWRRTIPLRSQASQ
jgi:putative ABC transport system permease protein